uniref:Uncharacterized protein n=1 Tax=Picea glauca TaxID=3330 RepID=A0A101LY90_PICGL|nr:hypothetical protein ABT39_MTgene5717 [Picea glauca]
MISFAIPNRVLLLCISSGRHYGYRFRYGYCYGSCPSQSIYVGKGYNFVDSTKRA